MPSGEWTDGAFPIRRARIVAARLDTYRPSSPTASTWAGREDRCGQFAHGDPQIPGIAGDAQSRFSIGAQSGL
jgi:hypothetical protein